MTVGLRTSPSLEKPLGATTGPDDKGGKVEEGPGSVDEGSEEEGGDTALASAVPKRVNNEHKAGKAEARNIFREGRGS